MKKISKYCLVFQALMSLKVGLLKEHNFCVFKGKNAFSLKTLLRVIKYKGVKLCGKKHKYQLN